MERWNLKIIAMYLKLTVELFWAKIRGNTARVTELLNELSMSVSDPRWLEVIEEYLQDKEQNRSIPYIRYKDLSDFIIPIGNKCRIAFISDWGTGQECAEWLLKSVMKHANSEPDLVIHLGDIYYSGTMKEVKNNYYNIIKKYVNFERTKVYTLSGNHDMYSGGEGYYWLLKQLNQPASYFCLRNDYWQFLAMDTGQNDSNPFTSAFKLTYVDPAEVRWHLDKFNTAGKRKTVLLSHHQLFSDLGVGMDDEGRTLAFNPHLYTAYHNVLDQVELWLWGHEHNLLVFNPYLNLRRGRCIGASAFPVMNQERPYEIDKNLYLQGQSSLPSRDENVRLSTNIDGFYYHAFAIMELNNENAKIEYYQVDSINDREIKLLYTEALSNGKLQRTPNGIRHNDYRK